MHTMTRQARWLFAAATAALTIVGSADAQPNRSTRIINQCIDPGGRTSLTVCRVKGPSSKLDICQCPQGGRVVRVPVCGPGERAPKETRNFLAWRAKVARKGDLSGQTWEGQAVCIKR